MAGIGNLFKAMKRGMQDDKGLFQGGKQGQSFGRIKDVLGMSPKDEYGDKVSRDPSMERSEEEEGLWQHARGFAENIDVSREEDVGELQSLLNQLGITDRMGESFKEDSIMGEKTLYGLRQLQGLEPDESDRDYQFDDPKSIAAQEAMKYGSDSNPNSAMRWLFGGGKRRK
tara:strand:+ start:311 stop:823 length:513 start_codon:yes stop_codon:yes gene_type:complete